MILYRPAGSKRSRLMEHVRCSGSGLHHGHRLRQSYRSARPRCGAWVRAYRRHPRRLAVGPAPPLSGAPHSDSDAAAGPWRALGNLQEQLDTSTSGGKLVFHFFGALAEFEPDLIRERTMAGSAAARARGRRGGRPGLSPEKVRQLRTFAADRANTVGDICKTLGISRATFYRYVASGKV
jgi:hypothetical protein